MRPTICLILFVALGCQMLSPPTLPPPPAAPPGGDTLLLFDQVVPSTPEAIREAFARRIPPDTAYSEVYHQLGVAGFPIGMKTQHDKRWQYTTSAPLLMISRWGMVQDVRIQVVQDRGVGEVFVGPAQRLPESAMLEAHPEVRRVIGMNQAEAEELLREQGFAVRNTTAGLIRRYKILYARLWSKASLSAASVVLVCHIAEDGRIATLTPATATHPTRSFDGAVGMFPSRNAPAVEQMKAYARIPVWTAEAFTTGMLQWMFLPLGI